MSFNRESQADTASLIHSAFITAVHSAALGICHPVPSAVQGSLPLLAVGVFPLQVLVELPNVHHAGDGAMPVMNEGLPEAMNDGLAKAALPATVGPVGSW